jgi:hypothetical protein
MLRGGEDCALVTVPRLVYAPDQLPLPPLKMRPELVVSHTVSWEKLQNSEERAAETSRMVAALGMSGFCYLTVTREDRAVVARAMQAARRYFAKVGPAVNPLHHSSCPPPCSCCRLSAPRPRRRAAAAAALE